MWLKIYIVNVCLQLLESKFKEKSNELKKLEEIVQAVKTDKDKMNNKWVLLTWQLGKLLNLIIVIHTYRGHMAYVWG